MSVATSNFAPGLVRVASVKRRVTDPATDGGVWHNGDAEPRGSCCTGPRSVSVAMSNFERGWEGVAAVNFEPGWVRVASVMRRVTAPATDGGVWHNGDAEPRESCCTGPRSVRAPSP